MPRLFPGPGVLAIWESLPALEHHRVIGFTAPLRHGPDRDNCFLEASDDTAISLQFPQFLTLLDDTTSEPISWLVRGVGKDSGNLGKDGQVKYKVSLPTKTDVDRCLAIPVFDKAPWGMSVPPGESFRNCLEGFSGREGDPTQNMHNIVHDWVGGMFLVGGDRIRYGTMEPLETSPNDPIFFIHHASVDRLWAQWEESHPDAYEPQGEGQVGWNPEDTMYPFDQYGSNERMKANGLTIKSMLGTKDLNYEYR